VQSDKHPSTSRVCETPTKAGKRHVGAEQPAGSGQFDALSMLDWWPDAPFKKVALYIFGVHDCTHGVTPIVFPAEVSSKCGDLRRRGGNPGRAFSLLQITLGDERGADAPKLKQ